MSDCINCSYWFTCSMIPEDCSLPPIDFGEDVNYVDITKEI